jgi:hypothetical protein
MGGNVFDPKKPEPQLEHHDKLNPNKKEPELVPPLFGLATRGDAGVSGRSPFAAQPGVFGQSDDGDAVFAESTKGNGVHARGGNLAGLFEGNVEVTGNINLTGPTSDIMLQNEDCAEQFNVLDGSTNSPGTVMVLDDEGLLRPSRVAYDKRVAGVISGAGKHRPAVTLGVAPSTHKRVPIALMGKVYCWADAGRAPIEVGDLLTTSPTEGHAMAVSEPARAIGTIIGKALQPLASGRGLIPILVALQ